MVVSERLTLVVIAPPQRLPERIVDESVNPGPVGLSIHFLGRIDPHRIIVEQGQQLGIDSLTLLDIGGGEATVDEFRNLIRVLVTVGETETFAPFPIGMLVRGQIVMGIDERISVLDPHGVLERRRAVGFVKLALRNREDVDPELGIEPLDAVLQDQPDRLERRVVLDQHRYREALLPPACVGQELLCLLEVLLIDGGLRVVAENSRRNVCGGLSEPTQNSFDERVVIKGKVKGLPNPLVVEEVGWNRVAARKRSLRDIEVEGKLERFQEKSARVERDSFSVLELVRERWLELNRVVITRPQAEHDGALLGDVLPACVECSGLAPVVLEYLEVELLVAFP